MSRATNRPSRTCWSWKTGSKNFGKRNDRPCRIPASREFPHNVFAINHEGSIPFTRSIDQQGAFFSWCSHPSNLQTNNENRAVFDSLIGSKRRRRFPFRFARKRSDSRRRERPMSIFCRRTNRSDVSEWSDRVPRILGG